MNWKRPVDYEINVTLLPKGKRARRVISRARARPTMKYPSWRDAYSRHAESPHELAAFKLCDTDPSVIDFYEQPAIISIRGLTPPYEQVLHYPDLFVQSIDGRRLVEIKTEDDAFAPAVSGRTAVLRTLLPLKGFVYELWTNRELNSPAHKLKTAEKLLRYGHRKATDISREAARRVFEEDSLLSYQDAISSLTDWGGIYLVNRLILEGYIGIDRSVPLIDSSLIRWVAAHERPPPTG